MPDWNQHYRPTTRRPIRREIIKAQCEALGLAYEECGPFIRVASEMMFVNFFDTGTPAFYTHGLGIYDTPIFTVVSSYDGEHHDQEWFQTLMDFFFEKQSVSYK